VFAVAGDHPDLVLAVGLHGVEGLRHLGGRRDREEAHQVEVDVGAGRRGHLVAAPEGQHLLGRGRLLLALVGFHGLQRNPVLLGEALFLGSLGQCSGRTGIDAAHAALAVLVVDPLEQHPLQFFVTVALLQLPYEAMVRADEIAHTAVHALAGIEDRHESLSGGAGLLEYRIPRLGDQAAEGSGEIAELRARSDRRGVPFPLAARSRARLGHQLELLAAAQEGALVGPDCGGVLLGKRLGQCPQDCILIQESTGSGHRAHHRRVDAALLFDGDGQGIDQVDPAIRRQAEGCEILEALAGIEDQGSILAQPRQAAGRSDQSVVEDRDQVRLLHRAAAADLPVGLGEAHEGLDRRSLLLRPVRGEMKGV
jgi:hypothetical protein